MQINYGDKHATDPICNISANIPLVLIPNKWLLSLSSCPHDGMLRSIRDGKPLCSPSQEITGLDWGEKHGHFDPTSSGFSISIIDGRKGNVFSRSKEMSTLYFPSFHTEVE